MSWNEIEKAFLKAWASVFSKHKLLMSFIALSLCGILLVFCRALSIQASSWVGLSLLFLPILLSSGLLLSLGVLLVRIYSHETKGLVLKMGRLFAGSADVAIGTSYLSLPPLLIYLLLWIALGLFFLIKEIPLIGPFFNVILAFGPFLLIFCSLLLCLLNVGLLFFVAPAAAMQSAKRLHLAQRIWQSLKLHPFASFVLFFIGLLPALAIGSLLTIAAVLTNLSFSLSEPSFALALEWFFVMLPFCALLSPTVVFFFHFSAESHQLLQRR
ncbi:MAG: hypothetical protein KGJ02_07480 [Verrucomicrobiota bacterium]|nr:hypothetical protein [Verrucomicrobiota bacterium]